MIQGARPQTDIKTEPTEPLNSWDGLLYICGFLADVCIKTLFFECVTHSGYSGGGSVQLSESL